MKIFGKRISLVLALVLAFSMVLNGLAFAADGSENKVERIAGKDRFETSVAIAKDKYGKTDTAIIAGGGILADSLSASVLAGAKDAPIIVTPQDRLLKSVKEGLEDLGVKNAIILGSDAAVSTAVQSEIEKMGIKVKRIGGKDRFETAVLIANEAQIKSDTAYVVNGMLFADSMVVGPAAFAGKGPIMPVLDSKVPAATLAGLKDLGIKKVIIVGGETVVSNKVKSQLEQEGIEVLDRIAGANREETSVAFAKKSYVDPVSGESTIAGLSFVNGYDGLFDAAGASVYGNPVLYAQKTKIIDSVQSFTKGALENKPATKVTVFGGETVFPNNLLQVLQNIVNEAQPKELKINSVRPVATNKVVVEFNVAVEQLTPSNFAIDGGLSVIDVEMAANSKSATLALSSDMADGAEYTLTATEVKVVGSDKVSADVSAKFKYELTAVGDISLTKSVFENGEKVTDYLVVKDKNGVEISKADYVVTNIESSNNTVVDANGNVIADEGTANLRFTIKYKDGSIWTSNFLRVDVEKAVTGELAGFELDKTQAKYKNTVDYRLNGQGAKTFFYKSDDAHYLWVYADDTKGNPETADLDLKTGGSYKVTSKQPAIISVSQDVTGAKLTPVAIGKATIEITGPNNYKKTLPIEVKEDPVIKDVYVSATNVKLSDEAKGGLEIEGVNQQTVELRWVDQYGVQHLVSGAVDVNKDDEQVIGGAFKAGDKLVISTTSNAFKLSADTNNSNVKITANSGKTVNKATVRVSYFEKATDAQPKISKSISTTVVDVDANSAPVKYEALVSNSAIDAAGNNEATVTVYALDKNGNRLADVSDQANLSYAATVSDAEKEWFEIPAGGNTIKFKDGSFKYLTETGSLKLEYKVDAGSDPHGTVTVNYSNSWPAPNKAVVNASSVTINTKDAPFDDGITVDELLFGLANDNELVLDDITTPGTADQVIAVKKGFTGYYNKPILSFKDVKGNTVKTGVNLYGLKVVSGTTTGNVFFVDPDNQDPTTGVFEPFAVEYSVTNANNLDTTAPPGTFKIEAGKDQATFTIVITKVTAEKDPRTEAKNLLDQPVAVNVILTSK